MNYSDVKRQFIAALVARGSNDHEAAPDWIRAQVPERILERWAARFYKAARPKTLPSQMRLVNHFSLGADPEFMMVQPNGEIRPAENESLYAGLCFGADNNGRLVELRPAAHRSALWVVASILSELRWLGLTRPNTLGYNWKAGCFAGKDGLGGHIHFGRKRVGYVTRCMPNNKEVVALDRVAKAFFVANLFDMTEQKMRRNAHYGDYSDVRYQAHGYEYRTFPSWLGSPWLSFLHLVVAKLAVHDPAIMDDFGESKIGASEVRRRLRNLLATYKGRDDDALFAYLGLDVWGMPAAGAQPDFKANWGIGPLPEITLPYKMPALLPGHIKPTSQEVEECFQHICSGRALDMHYFLRAPNWEHQQFPEGFQCHQGRYRTYSSPGLGELVADLCTPMKIQISYLPHDGNLMLRFSEQLFFRIGRKAISNLRLRYPKYKLLWQEGPGDALAVQISKGALTPQFLSTTKELLTQPEMPFVRLRDVAKFDLKRWQVVPPAPRMKSKILYPIGVENNF